MKYLHTFELPIGTYYISRGPFQNDSSVGKFKCWKNGCGISSDFNTMAKAETFLSGYMIADLKRRNLELEKEVAALGEVLEVIEDVNEKSWIYNFKVSSDN